MGKWRFSSIIYLCTRWRLVTSFMPLLLYSLGNSPLYTFCRVGPTGVENILLPLPVT
jgi:hypothetical protein